MLSYLVGQLKQRPISYYQVIILTLSVNSVMCRELTLSQLFRLAARQMIHNRGCLHCIYHRKTMLSKYWRIYRRLVKVSVCECVCICVCVWWWHFRTQNNRLKWQPSLRLTGWHELQAHVWSSNWAGSPLISLSLVPVSSSCSLPPQPWITPPWPALLSLT